MSAGKGISAVKTADDIVTPPEGVVLRDVSKFFGDTCAVKDLNLEVAHGEFLTLLGPSGSGKTTTLMMLAGFQRPTKGEIRIAGRSIHNVPPHKRNIGMVFQNYALFPHMTVRENIAFPLSVRGVPQAETQDAIARALDLVRLAGLSERRPNQLSGGQQQRVALARALVFNPPLILMDEPLGALDRQLRERLQIEIKQIHAKLGVTLIYVTHDQSEALTMSDRVAVFNEGAIQQIATPVDIYERPANAFVAQFIGDSNHLEGRITSRDCRYCDVDLDCGFSLSALAITKAAVGERVVISSRPERLLLVQAGDSTAARTCAEVTEIIYHGDSRRVRLRIANDHSGTLMGKVPNGRGDLRLEIGTTVAISWHPEDWRAFDPLPRTAGKIRQKSEGDAND